MLRKLLFWLHLGAAIGAGSVILLLALTGLLLSFEEQIVRWSDREVRRVGVPASAASSERRLEPLLAQTARERPELAVVAVSLPRDPAAAVTLHLGRDGVLFVDPYGLRIVGPGSNGARAFFRRVTELHRTLGARDGARPAGKAITGGANLLFVVVLLSGLYLWIPRRLAGGKLRHAVWFRRGLSPKARDFNWHHVFGVWALVPLLVMVVSALPMSYRWAGDVLTRITGGVVNRSPESRERAPRPETPRLAGLDLRGIDLALERARNEAPDWTTLSVRLPASDPGSFAVSVDRSAHRGRPDLRSQLTVDRESGAVVAREAFADATLGRRVRSWMRWLHTGEAGGWIGQAVAALACAATLLLGWTGYALAWRRFLAWRRRQPGRRSRASAAAIVASPATHPAESLED